MVKPRTMSQADLDAIQGNPAAIHYPRGSGRAQVRMSVPPRSKRGRKKDKR